MKNIILSMLMIGAVSLMSFIAPSANNYKVDESASELVWTGYHLAKSYEHTGNVKIKSGELTTDGSKITSGTVVIDMTTITNTDLTDEKNNTKLVGHLKSADFFAVKKYPEAKIVIKSTSMKANNTYTTVADITIRGITKEIAFDTKVTKMTDTEIVAEASMRIKRTDFEVMYGWSLENAILDGEFKMDVKLVAKK